MFDSGLSFKLLNFSVHEQFHLFYLYILHLNELMFNPGETQLL